jgi:hypothetical protein
MAFHLMMCDKFNTARVDALLTLVEIRKMCHEIVYLFIRILSILLLILTEAFEEE